MERQVICFMKTRHDWGLLMTCYVMEEKEQISDAKIKHFWVYQETSFKKTICLQKVKELRENNKSRKFGKICCCFF